MKRCPVNMPSQKYDGVWWRIKAGDDYVRISNFIKRMRQNPKMQATVSSLRKRGERSSVRAGSKWSSGNQRRGFVALEALMYRNIQTEAKGQCSQVTLQGLMFWVGKERDEGRWRFQSRVFSTKRGAPPPLGKVKSTGRTPPCPHKLATVFFSLPSVPRDRCFFSLLSSGHLLLLPLFP